jgi:hypothetical protein
VITIDNTAIFSAAIVNVLKRLRYEALVSKAAFKKMDIEAMSGKITGNWKNYYKSLL